MYQVDFNGFGIRVPYNAGGGVCSRPWHPATASLHANIWLHSNLPGTCGSWNAAPRADTSRISSRSKAEHGSESRFLRRKGIVRLLTVVLGLSGQIWWPCLSVCTLATLPEMLKSSVCDVGCGWSMLQVASVAI